MPQEEKWIEVRLRRSLARRTERQVACVRGLGLRRIGSRAKLRLTPEVQGMINKVSFLIEVNEL